MEKYETVKRLGVGGHGSVYLVRNFMTKKLHALKKIEVDERRKTRTKEAVLKEASILSQLKHPHINLFHECFMDPTGYYVCIIVDYCDGGNLAERIQDAAQNGFTFSEKQVMQWFIQIVMAVQYIHSKHILHRDLKTENVFLNKRNVVKLGDFGISKILDNTIDVAKTVVGTPSYLSPELCQDIPYNSKSDIWAIGCLLYETSALERPFDGHSLIGLFYNIVKAEYKPLSSDVPEGIRDLVRQMLVKTPEDRPSASAVLNLPYVKSHLASFIADTESIRAIRSKRESTSITAGGDNNYLPPPPPSEKPQCKKLPLLSKSPQTPRKSRSYSPALPPKGPEASSCYGKYKLLDGTDMQTGMNLEDIDKADKDDDTDYSDDFDDSSASEIEEDIPEDEDTKDGGEAKSEEEVLYADDFEDCDSDEDLDEVVNQAKDAQALEPIDECFFEEDDEMALSQTLTQTQVFRSHMEAMKSHLPKSSDS